ncbi:MAG: nitroreductase family deazaflavin-dependent oxidoreductase [Acidimicrobiia bacterium]|nr:nitroreductase family deazaflavin-dependent oxidoreductase [Acidimicrobiia bacterium]
MVRILQLGLLVIAAGAVVLAVFVVSMRSQYPPVLRAVKRMNKAFWNPRVLETAGQVGATASVVEHRGRTSGNEYRTPVSMYPIEGGFLIPLVYGRTADWTKNVMSAGSGVIVHDGTVYQIERPEFVARSEAESSLPERERRLLKTMNVAEVLRVDAVPSSVRGSQTTGKADDRPVPLDRPATASDA